MASRFSLWNFFALLELQNLVSAYFPRAVMPPDVNQIMRTHIAVSCQISINAGRGGGGSNNNIFEVKYIFLPSFLQENYTNRLYFLPFWGQHRCWRCVGLKSSGKVSKFVKPLERMESRDVLGKIWCKTFHERDFCGCQPSILGELARTNMRRMNTKVLGNMSKYWTTKVINTMSYLHIFNKTKKY